MGLGFIRPGLLGSLTKSLLEKLWFSCGSKFNILFLTDDIGLYFQFKHFNFDMVVSRKFPSDISHIYREIQQPYYSESFFFAVVEDVLSLCSCLPENLVFSRAQWCHLFHINDLSS